MLLLAGAGGGGGGGTYCVTKTHIKDDISFMYSINYRKSCSSLSYRTENAPSFIILKRVCKYKKSIYLSHIQHPSEK